MKKPVFAGLVGCLAVSATLLPIGSFAEEPVTIIVTASRGAETVDESMAPVTVIDESDIRRSGASSVDQILAQVPGLIISNNGGPGKTSSVFLRGTESDHVLVLIDGVKMGSATLGTTPFHDIPLSIVEKIEIVRGSRSSLYGSEAIGGVIQIFTRKGGDGTVPIFSLSAGSHGSHEVQAGIVGGDKDAWYSVLASNSGTDGFNSCRGDSGAGCFTVEPDDDGYDNTSISLRAGGQVTDRLNIQGNLLNSDNETEFDGSFQNESETASQLASIKASFSASDRWNSSLLYAQTTDDSDNFINGVFASRFETERTQISWLNDLIIGNSRVITGLDYTDDEVDSNTAFVVSNRDNLGIFASFNTTMGSTDFEISLRNDDNEQFGSETTGGIAFGRDLSNRTRLNISYGTAFKAPTFNELYYPGFGNPDLDAETSSSIDLGISGHTSNGHWAINVFQTEIDDLIGFDPTTFTPVNIDETEISGIEFVGNMRVADWDISAALTLHNPEDTSKGANNGNQLPRRSETILQLGLDKTIGGWSFGGSLLLRGDSYDDPRNRTKLDGFTVVDFRTEYLFNPNWAFGLNVNNIFDKEYETAANYNQDGINGRITLRYIPNQ